MQPAPFDISLYRGDDFGLMLRVYSGTFSGAAYVKGAPLDLTGWTGAAQVRANEDGALLGQFEVGIVMPQTTPANTGRIYVSMLGSETAALAAAGIWDLELTDDSDPPLVFTYLKGKVTVTKDVTRVGS
jgi:hypothetical protein